MHVKPDGDAVYVTVMDKRTRKTASTTIYGVPKEKVLSDVRSLYGESSTAKPHRPKPAPR